MVPPIMNFLGVFLVAAAPPQAADDPLLRPIASDHASQWLTPQPPTRIFGNTYLVGFGGLTVGLIHTSAGLILIDGAAPQAVPQIEENIRSLGFELSDVKLILSTEPHYDHAGGIAALARDTGATVVASAHAANVLRRGRSGPDDPQMAWLPSFPSVQNIREVGDGERLRLGDVTVTALATPGHTSGSMSWTWRSCEEDRCVVVVFGSSLNPIAAGSYLFSNQPDATASFRRTFETLRVLPCDLLLTSHPGPSGGDVKFARFQHQPEPNPFLDPEACRTYVDRYEEALNERLAKEAVTPQP
ncbi:subclass B3 metallo-beta-lactamase [Allosphingosinicella sp.]|uniref:subclass B3 metallo-beta-lactamase n=1 Tax=Allosphingosinicella sp. TaxID=2823234 RepID=UPI002FC125FD